LGLGAGVKARGWSRCFDASVVLNDRRELVSLLDASRYIMSLCPTVKKKSHWQMAAAELVSAAEMVGESRQAAVWSPIDKSNRPALRSTKQPFPCNAYLP
jgi:hypothetical protein